MKLTHCKENFIEIYTFSDFQITKCKFQALQQTIPNLGNQTTDQINDSERRQRRHPTCQISVKRPKRATVACWPAKVIYQTGLVERITQADQLIWNLQDRWLMSKLTLSVRKSGLQRH